MASTVPTRIDGELHASAAMVGEVMSRSATQQLNHWARIGREIEAGATVSHQRIASVVSGSESYDELTTDEQAIVRAEWTDRLDARLRELDVGAELAAEGRSYAELDDDGQVVVRRPEKSSEPLNAEA